MDILAGNWQLYIGVSCLWGYCCCEQGMSGLKVVLYMTEVIPKLHYHSSLFVLLLHYIKFLLKLFMKNTQVKIRK